MNGFFAMLSRMKYIERWSLMRCANSENLAEHTLETAILTHALINIANTRLGQKLDADKGASLALFHDVPEIITGDLPTPVKYHDNDIKKAYNVIEKQAQDRLLNMLPDDLKKIYSDSFDIPSEYKPYIKAADKLSALIKCIDEEKSGNKEFTKAKKTCQNHESLKLEAAQIFIKEFLPAYSLTLDEL